MFDKKWRMFFIEYVIDFENKKVIMQAYPPPSFVFLALLEDEMVGGRAEYVRLQGA